MLTLRPVEKARHMGTNSHPSRGDSGWCGKCQHHQEGPWTSKRKDILAKAPRPSDGASADEYSGFAFHGLGFGRFEQFEQRAAEAGFGLFQTKVRRLVRNCGPNSMGRLDPERATRSPFPH